MIMTGVESPDRADQARHLVPLSRQESIALLAGVSLGRIVFTARALPAVRPVNHVVDGGEIIIRTHHGTAITGAARQGAVVAYEADEIDPHEHLGWSVIVTGVVRQVTDQPSIERYEKLLRPWLDGRRDFVIRLTPEIVTGYRLVPGPGQP